MRLSEIVAAMEAIAPLKHAEAWDNVGLLAGDPAQGVSKVLLTIDCTMAVALEAEAQGCEAILAYHPPIFGGLKRIVFDSPVGFALRRGIALYSPHTALDAAPGGTNDVLADVVGMTARAPIRASATAGARDVGYKLVTFVPDAAVERVSAALFAAGAGRIGRYSSCSFRSMGTGTFFGEEGAQPAVGEAGHLETASEVRLETVVPLEHATAVIDALRASHPYEEPAFDLLRLASAPEASSAGEFGMGRIGAVEPVARAELFARIKRGLGIDAMLVAGATEGTVSRVAVAAGAAGELLAAAIAQRAEVIVTGEVRHHDALAAAAKGVTVVCALHSRSERVTLTKLADALIARLPTLRVHVSAQDRDPFAIL